MEEHSMPGPRAYLTEAFAELKNHFPFLFGLSFVGQLLFKSPGILSYFIDKEIITDPIQVFLSVIFILVLVMAGGYLTFMLSVSVVKKEYDLARVASLAKSYLLPSIWVNILRSVIIFFGYILFIIPGIIFSLMLGFADIAVLDQELRGSKALGFSRKITKGRKWYVLVTYVCFALFFVIMLIIPTILLGLFDSEILDQVITFICSVFILPFVAIFNFKVYSYLKSSANLI